MLPALIALVLGVAVPQGVRVESSVPCLEGPAIAARLGQVLKSPDPGRTPDLSVRVVASPADGGSRIVLTATGRDQSLVLERTYVVAAGDCHAVADLLALVLERFLATLPLDRWTIGFAPPAPSPRPPPSAPSAEGINVVLRPAAHVETFPAGGDVQLSLHFVFHGLSMGGLVRTSLPASVGPGRIYSLFGLLCLGWQRVGGRWSFGADLRAGPMWVFGSGFDRNRTLGLPWAELAPWLGARLGTVTVGLEAAGGLFALRAQTYGATRAISPLRLGVWVGIPIWH